MNKGNMKFGIQPQIMLKLFQNKFYILFDYFVTARMIHKIKKKKVFQY